MTLFSLMSVFAFVQMILFAHFKGLSFLEGDIIPLSMYSTTSMGNMGFSKSVCVRAPLSFHASFAENALIEDNLSPTLMF